MSTTQQVLVVDRLFVRDTLYMGGKEIKGLQAADEDSEAVNKAQLDAASGDVLVKQSAADTTAGYLDTKLVAGSGITLNVLNPGANESVEIVSGGGTSIVSGDTNTSVTTEATADVIEFTAGSTLAANVNQYGLGILDGVAQAAIPVFVDTASTVSEIRNQTAGTPGRSFYSALNSISESILMGVWGTTAAGTTMGLNRDDLTFLESSSTPMAIYTVGPDAVVLGTGNTASLTIDGTTQAVTFTGAANFQGGHKISTQGIGVGSGVAAPTDKDIHVNGNGASGITVTTGGASYSAKYVADNAWGEQLRMAMHANVAGTFLGVAKSRTTQIVSTVTPLSVGTLAAADLTIGTNDTASLTIDGTTQAVTLADDLNMGATLGKGLVFGDGDTSIYESADDKLTFKADNSVIWTMEETTGVSWLEAQQASVRIGGAGSNYDTLIGAQSTVGGASTAPFLWTFGTGYSASPRGTFRLWSGTLVNDNAPAASSITGVGAYPSAVTNPNGGAVTITGGAAATGSGNGGDVILYGGTTTAGAEGNTLLGWDTVDARGRVKIGLANGAIWKDAGAFIRYSGRSAAEAILEIQSATTGVAHIMMGRDSTNTNTDGIIAAYPGNKSGRPIMMMQASGVSNTSSTLRIGGGPGGFQAATSIIFNTAASWDTDIGTNAMTINGTQDIGMGTAAPLTKLHLEEEGSNPALRVLAYGTGQVGIQQVGASRGTQAAPTALQSGDQLGVLSFIGQYNTGAGNVGNGAALRSYTTETWGVGARGAEFRVYTVPNTTTTETLALTVAQNQDVQVENGILRIKEASTPSGLTDYGAVYTKNTNDLWFQDGAGVEHQVALLDQQYAEMHIGSDQLQTISTANTTHGIIGFSDGHSYGFTFQASATATINSIADATGGDIEVTTSAAHGFTVGDPVTLVGGTGYDGEYVITAVDTTTTFDVTATYVATGTGTAIRPSNFAAPSGISNGTAYWIHGHFSLLSAGNNKDFQITSHVNATLDTHHQVQRRFANTTDIGTASTGGIIEVDANDRIWMCISGLTDTTNITIKKANVSIGRV